MLAKCSRTVWKKVNFYNSLRDHFPMAYISVANFRDETVNVFLTETEKVLEIPF